MKKVVQSTLLTIFTFALFSMSANAQSKLIHYWNFNNFSGAYYYPTIPNVKANYSAIDTNKAQISYQHQAGWNPTSYTGITYIDAYTVTDTVNALQNVRRGDTVGIALRVSNPSDSMQLLFYVPTTGYKNVALKYISYPSSTSSGQKVQLFDYSVDSGATWKTTGLSKTSDTSTGKVWKLTTITFDSSANNKKGLVFRIRFSVQTSSSSGNNRFDNVTVEGDSIVTTPPPAAGLIHYWHFNNLLSAYHNPSVPAIKADYSALDTNKATIAYTLSTGTSSTYAGYIDNVAGDTLNARRSAPAGQGLRVRNPTDSVSLRFYIPTTGYKNIVIKYALQSSSITSGMLAQLFDYSLDSGATWKTSGLNMVIDSVTQPQFQQAVFGGPVVIFFPTDSNTNNNSKLVFRIKFAGNTNLTSGNNRFDNVTVESVSSLPVSVPTVSTKATASALAVYPNPSSSAINISTGVEGNKSIAIFNNMGQRVYYNEMNGATITVNVANLTTGVYYVQVLDNNTHQLQMATFVKK